LLQLSEPLVVYRGCCELNQLGYSWTRDRQRAERFAALAQEWSGAKHRLIISGHLRKAHVLAYITERCEAEIVALPENLTAIRHEDITHLPLMTETAIKRLGKNTR
jgi:hypothetical protein